MCKIEKKAAKEKMLCPLYNFIVKDGFLYCFSWKYNLYLKFCMATGEIEYKKTINEYPANAFMLFRLICLEDKIVAFPYVANHIMIWQLQSMDIQELQLPLKYSDNVFLRKFNTYIQRENEIYLFPGDIDYICQIDLTANRVKEVLNIRKYLLEKYNFCYSFFANGSFLKDNEVYLGCFETNKMIKYDISTNRAELIDISEPGEIRSICGNGSQIFILFNNGKLIIRNVDTSEIFVKRICDEKEMDYWHTGETRMVCYSGYVFAFPENIEFSKRIRISDGEVTSVFEEQCIWDMKRQNADRELFFGYFDKGIIYVYSDGGDIFYFNADTLKKAGSVHLNYDTDELIQWVKKHSCSMKMAHEDPYICNISALLDVINGTERTSENDFSTSVGAGEIIYQEIKQENEKVFSNNLDSRGNR